MARKPTIVDLARDARLGAATVDRVLHGRAHVSERARQGVLEAALRLGYPLPAALRAEAPDSRPALDLGFVLHKPGQAFYQDVAEQIAAACRAHPDLAITPHIRFAPSQAPQDFVREIEGLAPACAAIAATAVNHPGLARLAGELTRAGRSVFSVLNDFAGAAGAGYFGLDNMRVGRLAGWMMATRLQGPGKVAVFVGGTRWHGQAMRDAGLRAFLGDRAPGLSVLESAVNLETRQLTYEATLELLDRVPDLGGLYVAGGGMEGAIAALRELRPADRLTLIVNELTPESSRGLADRYVTMVIATPVRALCAGLVEAMAARALRADARAPQRTELPPRLYLPESV